MVGSDQSKSMAHRSTLPAHPTTTHPSSGVGPPRCHGDLIWQRQRDSLSSRRHSHSNAAAPAHLCLGCAFSHLITHMRTTLHKHTGKEMDGRLCTSKKRNTFRKTRALCFLLSVQLTGGSVRGRVRVCGDLLFCLSHRSFWRAPVCVPSVCAYAWGGSDCEMKLLDALPVTTDVALIGPRTADTAGGGLRRLVAPTRIKDPPTPTVWQCDNLTSLQRCRATPTSLPIADPRPV